MVTATRSSDVPAESHLLGDTRTYLAMRVRGSEHDGRVLQIRSPKCVIGSDPGCTLRLDADGVRPVHCLVLRAAEGTFVRRWSAGTTLNGHGFDIARIQPGDCLTVGTVELEFLSPTPCGEPGPPILPPDPPPASAGSAAEYEPRYRELEGHLQEAQRERSRLEELVQQQQRELAAALEGVKSGQQQIAQLRTELSQRAAQPPAPRPGKTGDPSELSRLSAELAEAKDLVLCLRDEMQKQVMEHQRARDKWDTDRQALERKVAECAVAAGELQRYYDQYMEEAEVLMHAMQQEGKNMLLELEEAREQLQEAGLEQRKTSSLAQSVWSFFGHGTAPETPGPDGASESPGDPGAVQPAGARPAHAACPTLLMNPPGAGFDTSADDDAEAAGVPHSSPDKTPALSPTSAEDRETARPGTTDIDRVVPLAEPPGRPPLHTVVMSQPGPAASADEGDDDQVIERYMERLLRRVAKIPDDVDTPPQMVAALQARVTAPRPDLAPLTPKPPTPSQLAVTMDHTSSSLSTAASRAAATPDAPAAKSEAVINRLLKPREPMPQLAADLLAMRELANRTARRAVDRHEYRHGMVAAAGQCVVATVCLISGGILATLSRGLFSAPMIGGTLGFSFGIIFLMRGLVTFQRLRKMRAPADDDE
ncbi:MAG: hypothetical protein MUF48_03840 [Pirellulaceae bacterium]|jgi:hypothetical protein|nr:hypothetical protein [Pirellulaceae bacterium]